MSTDSQNKFISALAEHEKKLAEIGFSYLSTDKKGYATYITYKATNNFQALFMYGPSDWHVELTLTKNGTKYGLGAFCKTQQSFNGQVITASNCKGMTKSSMK